MRSVSCALRFLYGAVQGLACLSHIIPGDISLQKIGFKARKELPGSQVPPSEKHSNFSSTRFQTRAPSAYVLENQPAIYGADQHRIDSRHIFLWSPHRTRSPDVTFQKLNLYPQHIPDTARYSMKFEGIRNCQARILLMCMLRDDLLCRVERQTLLLNRSMDVSHWCNTYQMEWACLNMNLFRHGSERTTQQHPLCA